MLELKYSLVIEATEDPNFFGFYSPHLEGFTGIGHSIEDCLYKARWGMEEHVALLAERNMPVPESTLNPVVVVQNEQRPNAGAVRAPKSPRQSSSKKKKSPPRDVRRY